MSCFELGRNTGPFSEQRLVMESPLPAVNYILVWREARERHVGVTYLAKVQAKYKLKYNELNARSPGLQHISYTAHLAFIEIVTHHFQMPSQNLTSWPAIGVKRLGFHHQLQT